MEELRCLLDTPGLRVFYDEVNDWLYTQWLGEHDEESVRQHVEHVFECLAVQPCTKLLSDHSLLTGRWRVAPPQTGQRYYELLAAQGVAYFAWVYSFSFSDHASMGRTLFRTARPVVALFDDVASAYEWLRRCH